MIDEFCIFNKGGAVLWSRKLNATKGNPVDDLIQNVLLEEVRFFVVGVESVTRGVF